MDTNNTNTINVESIIEMDKLYKEENKRNSVFNSRFLFKTTEGLANQIRSSSDQLLSNFELIKTYHDKIMTNAQMIKDVLTYEFLFYDPEQKVSTTKDLFEIVKQEIHRYQSIVGGHKIEDNEWLDLEQSNKRFKLKPSQIGIYNSLNKDDCYDSDLRWFFKKFTNHVRKFIGSDKITFDYKLYEDEFNNIGWVLFVCEDNDINE